MTSADAAAAWRWSEAQPSKTPVIAQPLVEFRALGPVEAVVAGRLVDLGAPKQRTLLTLLVSRVGQAVTVDSILEVLWANKPPPSAVTSLQAYVANLRRVLEPGRAPRTSTKVLRTGGRGYLLDSNVVEVDVHWFERRAMAAWQAWDKGDPHQALSEFEAGLALWRGEPYTEVSNAIHVATEVARLEELRLSVIEGRCAALLAVGAHEVAVAELEAFMQAHPLREYGCELLSLALYRAGRQAEALAVLRTNQRRLGEELGIDPRPALQDLEREILNHAPELDWRPTPAVPTTTLPSRSPVLPAVYPATPPWPRPAPDDGIFVGRDGELRQLAAESVTAADGHGRVVAISGEPGIGKTSLLRRFAEQAAGTPVLWGVCPEHVTTPPLWPWRQVLRTVGACCPRLAVPGPVAELLDEDAQHGDGVDAADATLRQFEAIVQYLTGASEATPLVIVLDHLHQADPSSLRLLAHLAASVPASRLMVAVAYRSDEASSLAETSAALARAEMTRLELDGLSLIETRALATEMLHWDVTESIAQQLRSRTGGNPFYLRELIKALAAEERLDQPRPAPVPVPVREVVLRRLAQLPSTAAGLLSVASVAGHHFAIDVIARAASIETDAALEAVDTIVSAGLIGEDQHRLGWFSFTHALTVEVLQETMGRLRRSHLQRQIGRADVRTWMWNIVKPAESERHWPLDD